MDIRKIGLLRKIVYIWRNFRTNHSYINGKNNQIKIRGGRKLVLVFRYAVMEIQLLLKVMHCSLIPL